MNLIEQTGVKTKSFNTAYHAQLKSQAQAIKEEYKKIKAAEEIRHIAVLAVKNSKESQQEKEKNISGIRSQYAATIATMRQDITEKKSTMAQTQVKHTTSQFAYTISQAQSKVGIIQNQIE
jgi:hypothetical protein